MPTGYLKKRLGKVDDFGQSFPEVTPDLIAKHKSHGGQPRPVLVKDGETDEVKEYVSAASAVRELNLSKKVVTKRLARGVQVIPGTTLRVSYKDSFQRWDEWSITNSLQSSEQCKFRDGDAMGLVLALDETMAKMIEPLAPHKSAFDISRYRSLSSNNSIPKPVVATISGHLSRPSGKTDTRLMEEFAL